MEFHLGKFGTDDIYAEWWALLLTLLVVIALVALIVLAVTMKNKDGEPFHFETRDITYAAICTALAFALSFLGVTLAYGGTITLFSTVPIMMYCYYFGFRKGLIVCTVYMMLQFTQNPYIISPWSAVFDYIIPYMSLCFLGVFSHKSRKNNEISSPNYSLKRHIHFFVGAGLYIAIRYCSHVLSGILFFAEYKWAGWSLLGYSLAYNSFIIIDFAIAMIAATMLLVSRTFNSYMVRSLDRQKNA